MWLVVNVVAHPRLDLGVLIDVARSNPLSERLWKLGGERLLGARARLALRLQHRAGLAQRTRLHLGGLVDNVIHPRTAKLWEVNYCWRSSATRSAQPSAATDPGSHVAHGGRPSLILDLISASHCTRRARSTLIRTRSPTPRPRSSQPLERDELCALVDSTTDPGSHVAHGGRPSTCAVFPPCPAVCSRPCLMCASPAALARRTHGGLLFVGLSPRASLVRLCTPNRSHKSFSQSRRKSKAPNKAK